MHCTSQNNPPPKKKTSTNRFSFMQHIVLTEMRKQCVSIEIQLLVGRVFLWIKQQGEMA